MMRAEDLVAFAGGRGIDLVSAAESRVRIDGLARPRRPTFKERLELEGSPILQTAIGSQSRVTRKPAWSQQDLGHALAGCPKMAELAAWFAWGRDDNNFSVLFRALMSVALRAADRDNWPRTLAPGEIPYAYIPNLTNLVFEADRHAQFYAVAPRLYAVRMDVTLDVWCGRLERRYLFLKDRYDGWLDEALHHISGWLHEKHPRRVDREAVAH